MIDLLPVLADAGFRPREWRACTPREIDVWLTAWLRRLGREADDRAWVVAHLMPRLQGLTLGQTWRLLLGREPGTGPGHPAPPPVEPGLSPEAAVAWMRHFVATAKARR